MADRLWQRDPDGNPRRRPEERTADPATLSAGRARPLRALFQALRGVYDHLGVSLLASFGWVFVAASLLLGWREVMVGTGLLAGRGIPLLPVAGGVTALVAAWVLLMGPLTAGVYRYARNAAASAEPELLDLLWGFRSALRRAMGLSFTQLVVTSVLAADCLFLAAQRSVALMVLGVVFGYLSLYWLLAGLYQWPLLAELEIGVLAVLRKSALLVLDNLVFTVVIGLFAIILTIVCWGFLLPALILWPATMAFLQTYALRALLRRYGLLPPEPVFDPEEDRGGIGWHE